jgi:hypothetical protein
MCACVFKHRNPPIQPSPPHHKPPPPTTPTQVEGPGKYERVSGSSLGGGTYWGLCRLLTRCKTFDEVLDLAETGDATSVDMTVGDIYGRGYDKFHLGSSVIASSFGKLAMKQEPGDGIREEVRFFLGGGGVGWVLAVSGGSRRLHDDDDDEEEEEEEDVVGNERLGQWSVPVPFTPTARIHSLHGNAPVLTSHTKPTKLLPFLIFLCLPLFLSLSLSLVLLLRTWRARC